MPFYAGSHGVSGTGNALLILQELEISLLNEVVREPSISPNRQDDVKHTCKDFDSTITNIRYCTIYCTSTETVYNSTNGPTARL
jgi:hypothetical protein